MCVFHMYIKHNKFFRDSQIGFNEQNHMPYITQSFRNVKRIDTSDSDTFSYLFVIFFSRQTSRQKALNKIMQ